MTEWNETEAKKKIAKRYEIRLLGKPFRESYIDNGKIKLRSGWIYEGKKYLEAYDNMAAD